MLKRTAAATLIFGLLLLSACNRNSGTASPQAASSAPAPASNAAPPAAPVATAAPSQPTINDSMTKVMSVQAQTIWDISSKAFNKRGDGLVASKLSAQDWAALADAGGHMRDRAHYLATADHIVVAGPGETILGADAAGEVGKIGHAWDAANASQITARIAANPTLFAARAKALAQAADDLVKATKIKDIKTVYRVSSGLDDSCDSCHKPFWGTDDPPPYPK